MWPWSVEPLNKAGSKLLDLNMWSEWHVSSSFLLSRTNLEMMTHAVFSHLKPPRMRFDQLWHFWCTSTHVPWALPFRRRSSCRICSMSSCFSTHDGCWSRPWSVWLLRSPGSRVRTVKNHQSSHQEKWVDMEVLGDDINYCRCNMSKVSRITASPCSIHERYTSRFRCSTPWAELLPTECLLIPRYPICPVDRSMASHSEVEAFSKARSPIPT